MNYVDRLAIEIETRKSQLKALRERNAEFACREIESEITLLKNELNRYKSYEAIKVHHIYSKSEN